MTVPFQWTTGADLLSSVAMSFLQLLPAAVSALVLGAHFLRAGNLALLVASLALIALMFVRRPWAARTIQVGLLIGALEWLRALLVLVPLRIQTGEPFARLAIILGSVAVVTTGSALLFRTSRLRQRFGLIAASTPGKLAA